MRSSARLLCGLILVRAELFTSGFEPKTFPSRREVFGGWAAAAALVPVTPLLLFPTFPAGAASIVTGPNDGNLPDLPPDAVRSYLQYRIPLQTSADFYVFELQNLLKDPSDYGEVNEFFQVNNNRGQGNPSRIEREFTNVFRILGLSMPPDLADEIRDAQFRFEKAVATLSKTTAGIRRDLPVELDPNTVRNALVSWDDGRKALNEIFGLLNGATGLAELKPIPPPGPQQYVEYGRSERRYVELKKKIKLCQNRGGQTLASAWGNLMVAGTVQDYCALPDANEYFYQ